MDIYKHKKGIPSFHRIVMGNQKDKNTKWIKKEGNIEKYLCKSTKILKNF
jgi:transposase